jgi:hypothetical protein
MLESKGIITTLSRETLRASVAKGCLQGGVLSSLLWSLVTDDLLLELINEGHYMIGYVDDIAIRINGKFLIAIPINGKFLQTVTEVLQTSLCAVQWWCYRTIYPSTPTRW